MEPNVPPYRVLVVDDDDQLRERVARLLRDPLFSVREVTGEIGSMLAAKLYRPHVVLLDLDLPVAPGERLFPLVRAAVGERAAIVLFSASDPDRIRRAAMANGAAGWLSKSESNVHLEHVVLSMARRAAGSGVARHA